MKINVSLFVSPGPVMKGQINVTKVAMETAKVCCRK